MLVACLVGVALRVCLVLLTPSAGPEGGDLQVYHQTAMELTGGFEAWTLPGSSFGYRSPLYFAYLALVYSLAGTSSYHAGQLANLLLAVVLLFLLYKVVSSAFGRRAAGAAVILRALLPTYVVTDVFLLSEVLFDVFLLGTVWLVLSLNRAGPRRSSLFLVGLTLGLGILVREFTQGLAVILVVGLAVFLRRQGAGRVGWVLLGLALVLSPWIARNTAVWGRLTPLSLTAGSNLHVGNHPGATGMFVSPRHPDHVHRNRFRSALRKPTAGIWSGPCATSGRSREGSLDWCRIGWVIWCSHVPCGESFLPGTCFRISRGTRYALSS